MRLSVQMWIWRCNLFMEYYSSQGLKRAAKQKTAYQPGIAKGAFLLLVAILFGFFMLLSIALSGTVLQPLANMPFFVDPTADLNDLEQMHQKLQSMFLLLHLLLLQIELLLSELQVLHKRHNQVVAY